MTDDELRLAVLEAVVREPGLTAAGVGGRLEVEPVAAAIRLRQLWRAGLVRRRSRRPGRSTWWPSDAAPQEV